jgi:sialate O-acetylesterase
MINPLTFYPISGAIWYQGESNVDQYPTYFKLMQQLVTCWRNEWKSDLSFYFVQIAPYTYNNGKSAYLREQQTLSRSIPNTGMVVISDLVSDTSDIHPKDKKEVGMRLANLALAKHYSQAGIIAEGPYFKEMQIKGKELMLSFTNCDNGLVFKPGKNSGFEIAGADSRYYSATVKLKGSLVSVSSKEVPIPMAVRYCFTDAALPTLYSKEGLPVNSFRTEK